MGAVRLAKAGEHLAHRDQLVLEAEALVRPQPVEIVEARIERLDATVHETIGMYEALAAGEHARIALTHGIPHSLERIAPFGLAAHEMGVDARLARLLVLEQQVGHPGVSRDDEDPLVEVVAASPGYQHVVEQGRGGGHRSAADLLYAVLPHQAAALSISPRCGEMGRTSRAAMNSGRGLSALNGFSSRFETAL